MNRKKINMKRCFIFLMSFMLLFVMPSFAQTAEPERETTEVTDTAETATGLPAELQLTDEQLLQVEKIFKMAQAQADTDRESYKGNALGLIEAARRRLGMIDYHIENILNPEQKNVYAGFKQNRRRDEEFFILTEGLLLTEAQQVKVKIILEEYREKLKSQRSKKRKQINMRAGMRSGMRGGTGGEMGGAGRGMAGGTPGGGMGRGGMAGGRRGPGSGMMDVFKKYDSKKAKQIRTVLTKDQQKMYKAIRKMQKKEMQERMQEQRKRM